MTFSLVVPIFVYFAGQCKLDLSEIVKRGGKCDEIGICLLRVFDISDRICIFCQLY